MYTVDRINRLQRYFNLAPIICHIGLDIHPVLNNLYHRYEMAVGFSVGQEFKGKKSVIRSPSANNPSDYVGARLARLEALVFGVVELPAPIDRTFWACPATGIALLTGAFSFWLGEMG